MRFTHLNVCLSFLGCFLQAKEGYLQGQIGNPDGEEKPNKKFYDPRVWIRKVSQRGACLACGRDDAHCSCCRVLVLVVVWQSRLVVCLPAPVVVGCPI